MNLQRKTWRELLRVSSRRECLALTMQAERVSLHGERFTARRDSLHGERFTARREIEVEGEREGAKISKSVAQLAGGVGHRGD